MKRIINKLFASLLIASGILTVCASCNEDLESFDNKAFTNSDKVGNILLKGTNNSETAIIKTAIANPEPTEVRVSYKADNSLVAEYTLIYGEKAIVLPAENYEIPENVSVIEAGALQGTDVKVLFKDLSTLDRNLVYVLPVTVVESNIDFLRSTRTTYFVVRGAALINSVGNISKNHLSLQAPAASTLKEMNQVTIEVLMRIDQFGKLISTVMGIEGTFLFRIGDAGIPDSQLQLATSSGNITDPAWQIPTNEWVHLAATFDSTNGAVNVYLNGVKKGETKTTNYRRAVNWATTGFNIGKSYDDARFLDGDVCEMRVWNRVLTADEIKAAEHFYIVAPDSEGLVAYWKFDEGSGKVIADHTGNGNTVVANSDITWKTVSLPQ